MKRLFGLLLVLSVCFYGCQKETSFETGGEASGSLQSDVGGECLPKTVVGTYEAGTALVPADNYIEVQVNVIGTGAYVVSTDTVNGMWFLASGVFTSPGLNTVKLKGNGTPAMDGISNFVVTFDSTTCDVAVTVLPSGSGGPAEFTFAGAPGTCMNAVVSGTYVVGTALSPATNTVVININVTKVGTYNITTTASNGMTFKAQGTLASLGTATITLTGEGTPGTTGATNIPVTIGTSTCSFEITVTGPATFTMDCAGATVNGTYIERIALTASNTITLPVTVTAIGGYTITGTINGMTFTATGTFTAMGNQNVTLTSTGTPTTKGANTLPLTGATTGCSVTINVEPNDYYPRTANSNWSYEFGGVANDSLLIMATPDIKTILTNPFTIFAGTTDLAGQGLDSAGYYRKSGGNYYRWSNLENYLGFDNEQFAEFIFIKDDQPLGHKWTTAEFSGTITEGANVFNVKVRISFEIILKDGTVTAKGIPYSNTITLKETYEVNVNNTGWQDGTPIYGYYQDSYSRNVGWILEKHFDENDVETTAAKIEMRRYVVAP